MPNSTYARSQGRNRFGRRYHGRFVTKGYLKAIVGVPETKYLDTYVAPIAATSQIGIAPTATTFAINNIPSGTEPSQRIGEEVSNRSFHIRLNIQRAAVDSLVRVIIYWNKDGAAQAPSNLLENNTAGEAYQSPLNKNYGKSFWVRFDKTYSIAAGQTQLVVDEIWRRTKCKTEYNASAINITANQLLISFISNQTQPANQPLISFTSRVNYMDV